MREFIEIHTLDLMATKVTFDLTFAEFGFYTLLLSLEDGEAGTRNDAEWIAGQFRGLYPLHDVRRLLRILVSKGLYVRQGERLLRKGGGL